MSIGYLIVTTTAIVAKSSDNLGDGILGPSAETIASAVSALL